MMVWEGGSGRSLRDAGDVQRSLEGLGCSVVSLWAEAGEFQHPPGSSSSPKLSVAPPGKAEGN